MDSEKDFNLWWAEYTGGMSVGSTMRLLAGHAFTAGALASLKRVNRDLDEACDK